MYVSMYDRIEIAQIERKKVIRTLGIYNGTSLIQPPRCISCGELAIVIEMDRHYIQCSSCGKITPLYVYKDTLFQRRNHSEESNHV